MFIICDIKLQSLIADLSEVGLDGRKTCRRTNSLVKNQVPSVTDIVVECDVQVTIQEAKVKTEVGLLTTLPHQTSINLRCLCNTKVAFVAFSVNIEEIITT